MVEIITPGSPKASLIYLFGVGCSKEVGYKRKEEGFESSLEFNCLLMKSSLVCHVLTVFVKVIYLNQVAVMLMPLYNGINIYIQANSSNSGNQQPVVSVTTSSNKNPHLALRSIFDSSNP